MRVAGSSGVVLARRLGSTRTTAPRQLVEFIGVLKDTGAFPYSRKGLLLTRVTVVPGETTDSCLAQVVFPVTVSRGSAYFRLRLVDVKKTAAPAIPLTGRPQATVVPPARSAQLRHQNLSR
jgi:hypothetical protein